MPGNLRPFRYLNHDGVWPGFRWDGLRLDNAGVLRLEALPRLAGPLPEEVAALPSRHVATGLAAAADGSFYFAGCSGDLLRVDSCSGEAGPVECAGVPLAEPAALLIPPGRRALFVADSAAGCIQVLDLDSFQWRQSLCGFAQPASLAADADGNLYVADTEAHRLDRITAAGDLDPSFWRAIARSGQMADPQAVACEGGSIFALDGQTHDVCRFDQNGQLLERAETSIRGARVLAVVDGVLYLGDPERRRVAVYARNQEGVYRYAGDAAGYEGPVTALAPDGRGGLLVSPGCGVRPLRLTLNASYRAAGVLWSGPVAVDDRRHFWNRIHAFAETAPGASLQFFFSDGPTPPPDPSASAGFSAPWRPVEPGVSDFFVGRESRALWIGAAFANDADSSPALSQLRLDFDQESYLPNLPAIYRQTFDDRSDDFLLRLLSLNESFFDELEQRMDRLPALLDPSAAPASALPWLAGFLDLPLAADLTVAQQRQAIAEEFERCARRGTVQGLREAVERDTGIRVTITEPIQGVNWWVLPDAPASCRPGPEWVSTGGSILGLTTGLAASEPQGAVVGTTATLDRSQLLSHEEYGSSLFDGVAYRFVAEVLPAHVDCPGRLAELAAVLDREKPAHTEYEICVLKPGIRIGYQARLGIDTLVGGGPAPTRLGEGELVLSGHPRGRIGSHSELGVTTQL